MEKLEMNKARPTKVTYIHTPIKISSPVKIDVVLEKRMKEFMLSRRRIRWLELGE